MPGYNIEELQRSAEYDPEGEGSVDDLIAYKDLLEDVLGSVLFTNETIIQVRGKLLGLYESWDDIDSGERIDTIHTVLGLLGVSA